MRANCQRIVASIKSLADPECVQGMARYGISPRNNYGVKIADLREMAKEIGKDHALALELWDSDIHDARLLACLVDEPEKVTDEQMEKWALDFDSWDVCDQCCFHLFDRTSFAYEKALEWTERKEEFVKRGGFAIMASLAVHDKKAEDRKFERFLPAIKKSAFDERNYVKKAVNWALRNIGKRNFELNAKALKVAREIKGMNSKAAHWIASDAIRELESEKVQRRMKKKIQGKRRGAL